jgi:hypothetical protein
VKSGNGAVEYYDNPYHLADGGPLLEASGEADSLLNEAIARALCAFAAER